MYRAVQAAWGSFVRRVEARERSVPRFCMREIDVFLRSVGFVAHHNAQLVTGSDDRFMYLAERTRRPAAT